jgi:hypothetical protein
VESASSASQQAACESCGAPLAADQRYCLRCGARAGPLAVPGASPVTAGTAARRRRFRVPAPRTAGSIAATTLAFGLFIGVLIGPSLSGTTYATGPLTLLLPWAANGSGGAGQPAGAAGAPALGSPVANPNRPSSPAPAPAPAPPPAPAAPTPAKTPPSSHEPQGPNKPEHHHQQPKPLPPTQPTIDGIVVHQNPAAGTYAVATSTAQLFAVHADKPPKVGAKVSAPVKSLFNGTFAETGSRTSATTAREAKIAGTVTYVDAAIPSYVVSARGVSALIHAPGATPGTYTSLPSVGDQVQVTAAIEQAGAAGGGGPYPPPAPPATTTPTTPAPPPPTPTPPPTGCQPPPASSPTTPATTLAQKSISSNGPTTFTYLEGSVEGVCPETSEVVLSADDVDESGATMSLTVAAGIDVSKLKVGSPVLADAEIGSDGALTISGIESDAGIAGAKDASSAQGDLAPPKNASNAQRTKRLGRVVYLPNF